MKNYFGKKSLSSVVYRFLTVLLYLGIAFAALVFILLIFNRIGNIDNSNLNLKMKFGILAFVPDNSFRLPLLNIIITAFNILIYFLILIVVRDIFKNFVDEKVFIQKNFISIRNTGLLIILSGISVSVMNFLNWNYIRDIIHSENVSIEFNIISEPELFITGGTILLFAHLFRMALKLQEENELTI